MAKGLKIIVSFKKTEKELYNYTKSKRNPSCYIKDLIEKDMKANSNNYKPIGKNNSSNNNDLGFDF